MGKRLITALIADGWWIAMRKTFLRPALRLYYTGSIADFLQGTIGVERGKAAKLRRLLSTLVIPSAEILSTDNPTDCPTVPPQIRTACASERTMPIPVGAVPIQRDQWPRAPLAIVSSETLAPDLEGWSPTVRIVGSSGSLVTATIATAHATSPPSDADHDQSFILVIASSIDQAFDFVLGFPLPTSQPQPPDRRIVVAYPKADDHVDSTASWFDPSFRLSSDMVRRTLPLQTDTPPPLPDDDTVSPPVTRNTGTRDITDQDFAALRTIAGLLSWLGVTVKVIGAWRPALERAWRLGVWSVEAAEAVRFLWRIAPWLPLWTRDIRRRPQFVLRVAVDAARCTWAARLSDHSGRSLWVAGTMPLHAAASSTVTREAWGAACATRAAVRRKWRFDAVDVQSDCSSLVARGERGGVPTPDTAPPMRRLAALDYQGIPVSFSWRARTDDDAPIVDAVSTAARTHVWPLRRHVASYLWDGVSGFHLDGPSDEDRSWTGRYLSMGPSESQRRNLFAIAAAEAAPQDDGWLGELGAYHIPEGHVLFAHPAWSQLAAVADVVERNTPTIVIAPIEGAGEWWSPHLERIQAAAATTRDLPLRATVPPTVVGPRDQGDYVEPPSHPRTGDRDMRRLRAYFCNVTFQPRPSSERKGARPSWWTPWRLTADGDVEDEPGPGFLDADDYSDTDGNANPRQPRIPRPSDRPHPKRDRSVTVQPLVAGDDLGDSTPPAKTLRRAERCVDAATIGRAPTYPPPPPPAAGPPPTTDAPGAPTGAAEIPTMRQWCEDMLRLAAGIQSAHGAAPQGVAPANAHAYAEARAAVARKANKGSTKPVSLPEMLRDFATMRGMLDHPWSVQAAEGFVLDFSQTRLSTKPPLNWTPVTKAACVRNDASRISAASTRAGYPLPAYCGKAVDNWTAARGGKQRKEHSAAFPIRLTSLLAAEPRNKRSEEWEVWAALVLISLFCLRPGIAPHLYSGMFVEYDGGYILIWRHNQKRTAAEADADREDDTSDVHAITAARHPVLQRIIQSANDDRRLFPRVNSTNMNAFIKAHISNVPPTFDVRAHGLRTGADADADTLGVPDDVIKAMFWWKRGKSDMRAYYTAINIRHMFSFSERRSYVILQPLANGLHDARVTDRRALDWSAPIATSLPKPPSVEDLERAVKAVSPSFIVTRRLRAAGRQQRARRALGLGPAPDIAAPVAYVLEGTCSLCFAAIRPKDEAAACMACDELACAKCVDDIEQDWRCIAHRQPLRDHYRAPRSTANRGPAKR
jgi:hypothetical protein